MIRLSAIRIIPVLLLVSLTGCALVESPVVAGRRMKRMFTPNPTDWDKGADEDHGEWDFVGDEGRGEYEREKDPDRWFKKFLMSDRANAIERNMGID